MNYATPEFTTYDTGHLLIKSIKMGSAHSLADTSIEIDQYSVRSLKIPANVSFAPKV